MPLRPKLYERLCRRLGVVRIADEDCSMQYTVDRDSSTGRPSLEINWSGEYYVVSCPYCNDTRGRLWINHRWGYLDPETRSRNLWLCHCFNQDCQRTYERQLDLYRRVFDDARSGPVKEDPMLRVMTPPKPREYEPPGVVVRVDALHADHPANLYLRGRGYDPVVLGPHLDIGFCVEPQAKYYQARNRLIIPVQFEGRLVGWQARLLGPPPDRMTPKYYSMPGFHKTKAIYNYDSARAFPLVVITEGVTDVWRVGPTAVSLFGKTLSLTQRYRVAAAWGDGTAVVLLDGDAADDARDVYDALAGVVRSRVLVQLPDGQDPGDLPTEVVWGRIHAAARDQGVALPLEAAAYASERPTPSQF